MRRSLLIVLATVAVVAVSAWVLHDPEPEWESCFDSPAEAVAAWRTKDAALADARAKRLKHTRLAEHKRSELEELQSHVEWGVDEQRVGLGTAVFTTKIEAERYEREILESGDTVGCLEEL